MIGYLRFYHNQSKLLKLLLLILIFPCLQACVAAGACVATGAAIAVDRRSAGTIVDDQAIEVKAAHAFNQNQTLKKNSRINAISYNNILLIVGQTPSEDLKAAVDIAVSDIAKVRRVHNEVEVKAPVPLAIRTQDSWITTQIKAKLLSSNRVNPARIKVVTEDGVVYLMGLITPEEQKVAIDIARNMEGVEKVIQIFERVEI